MGNGSSKADKSAQAKAQGQVQETIKKIQESLDSTAKTETDGLVGCKSRGAAKQRKKERRAEFQLRQKERTERKSKLSQQWEDHRDQNREPRPKKSLFGKKVEPKHWYDD